MDEFICFRCNKFSGCLTEKVDKEDCRYIAKIRRFEGDGTLCDAAEDIIGIRPLNLEQDRDHLTAEAEVSDFVDEEEDELKNRDYKEVLNEICEARDVLRLASYHGIRRMDSKTLKEKKNKLVLAGIFFDIDLDSISRIIGIPNRTIYYLMEKLKK